MVSSSTSCLPSVPRSFRSRCARFALAVAAMVLGAVVLGAVAVPAQAQTYLVLRPVPPKDKKDRKKGNNGIITTPLKKSDIGELKLNGKATEVTAISPLLGGDFGLQLVVLLDSMEKIGVNEQFDDMRKLFDHLPPNVEIGVGYMLQGKIRWAQLPTKDRKLAGDALKEPEDTASPKNDNGGPYNCLKYLSNHWPDPDPKKMRAVLMITDGVNRYNSFQGSDQDDPDVVAAAALLVRSGIMPFPFFYLDPVIPQGRSEGGQMDGQTNFDLLAATTQGYPLWEGQYAPATFDPLLEKFFSVLESMSVVTLNTTGNGYKQIDVTSSDPSLGINAPDGVTLGNVLKTKFSPNEK